MISNNERSEVARKLRNRGGRLIDMGELAEMLGFNRNSWSAGMLADRIADLIEPYSTIPTDPGEAGLASVEGFIREMRHSTEEEQDAYEAMLEKKSVELHPVDRDALLELADEMKEKVLVYDRLGLRVPTRDVTRYADRICDALWMHNG